MEQNGSGGRRQVRPGKDKWVKRYLSTKEKAECLDFPNTRTTLMTEELTNLLTKFEVPGKILVASLWYLTNDAGKLTEEKVSLGK